MVNIIAGLVATSDGVTSNLVTVLTYILGKKPNRLCWRPAMVFVFLQHSGLYDYDEVAIALLGQYV